MCSMMIEEDWGAYSETPVEPPKPKRTEEEKQAERKQAIHARFQEAVQNKDLEKLKASIAEGADINAEITIQKEDWRRRHSYHDSYGSHYHTVEYKWPNALLYVMSEGNITLARHLVESGADVNKTKDGKSCLYTAALKNSREWVDMILSSEAFDWDTEENRKALKVAESNQEDSKSSKHLYRYLKHRYWQHDGPWKNATEDTIAHVEYDEDGMIEITDRFNFASEERIRYMRDYTMNAVTSETLAFTDMSAKVQERVHEAWKALQKHNGTDNAATYKISRQRHYQRR